MLHAVPSPEPDDDSNVRPIRPSRNVATVLADLLADLGVELAFGVTGGPIARFVHALEDHHRIVWRTARTEGGAVLEAIGAWNETGEPVLAVTTCGPGLVATHQGLLIARSEGAHLVLVSPRTPAAQRDRHVPQDDGPPSVDFTSPGPLFDHVAIVESVDQLGPLAGQLSAGCSRPGAYVAHIILATDLLGTDAPRVLVPRRRPGQLVPDPATIYEIAARLRDPFFIVAGRGARADADLVRELVAVTGAPVVTTPGAKGVIDERDPRAFGVIGIGGTEGTRQLVAAVGPEIALVLGTRMSGASVTPDVIRLPRRGIVQVDRDAGAMGGTWDVPTLAVQSELRPVLEALLATGALRRVVSATPGGPPRPQPPGPARPGVVRPPVLMDAVQRVVLDGSDAPVFLDVGSVWPWATSCLRFTRPRRLHLETAVGSMGLAVSGGVGAALARGSTVVVLTGDWSFDMALPEVRTAIHHGAPVVWVVLQTFGGQMVLDGDEVIHGRRPNSAAFSPAGLAAAVRDLGAQARTVTSERRLVAALRAAIQAGGPYLVEVVADTSHKPPYGGRFDALRGNEQRR